MNHFEIQRQKFKPEKVSILFVAESPPQGGTFFYFQNSNLYSAVFNAFQNVFPNVTHHNFLEDFKVKGCYLEDLCVSPVNKRQEFERIRARMEGIPILTEKLKEYQPKVVIIIMKDISSYVEEAIRLSKIKIQLKVVAPFPVKSQTNIDNCINIVENTLRSGIKNRYFSEI